MLPDGTINLGQYGSLQVMGKTVQEIQEAVHEAVQAKTKDAGFISVRSFPAKVRCTTSWAPSTRRGHFS